MALRGKVMELRKISTQELQEIFAQHKLWVDSVAVF